MRITVIGPGAVGLLMAARLHQAGAEVGILDYRPERADLLSSKGFVLEDERGENSITLPAAVDPTVLQKTDLALVCVKAYQTEAVAQELADNLSSDARALTLQNGAGNVESLVSALGAQRVLGGITSEGSTRLGQDRVRHAGKGQTHIGRAQGEPDPFTKEIVELFCRAGFETEAAQGVQNLIWTKLLINVGINPLTAILDVPNGMLLELAAARALMRRAVAEAEEVGESLGIEFLHEDMLGAVRQVAGRTAQNISSMRADVLAKRRTEVEYINGAVAAQGLKADIPTPVNAALTNLVLAMEQKYL